MENVVTIKDLLETLSQKLRLFSELDKYNFSKNNKTLLYKDPFGSFRIELNVYKSFDLDRQEVSNEVIPYYYRKFNILHDWFKKHSILSTGDFNSRASVFLEGSNLGLVNNFHFLVTNREFDKDRKIFEEQLIKGENTFFQKFQTLKDLYEYEALPIINNKEHKFELHSDDDLFVLLRLVYLVSPENFEELNSRIYKHFLFLLNEYEHGPALAYVPKYDEIVNDLKNI